MHNDRLQGILFDQPTTLDLTRKKRISLRRKVQISRIATPGWLIEIRHPRAKHKNEKQHDAELADLQDRLGL